MAARPPAVTVLYDLDCGFCRWSIGRLLAWDRAGRLRPLAIQSAEGQRLLADLTPEERLATAHAIDGAGRRTSGGDALAPIAAVLPGGAPLAALGRLPELRLGRSRPLDHDLREPRPRLHGRARPPVRHDGP